MADRSRVETRLGTHATFQSALSNWDEHRWKSVSPMITAKGQSAPAELPNSAGFPKSDEFGNLSADSGMIVDGCKDLSTVLTSLGMEFDKDSKVDELVQFLNTRHSKFITDNEREQLKQNPTPGPRLCLMLNTKGRGESTLKHVYLALLDSYENNTVRFESHNILARKIVFRCSESYSASAWQGASPNDLKNRLTSWEVEELQDPQRIIASLCEHYDTELQGDVATEFMKNLDFKEEDFIPHTCTLHQICEKWYSSRQSRDGAFDELIAALVKTKSMGRLVSCVGLPSCHTSSHAVLSIFEKVEKDKDKCRLYLKYLGFDETELQQFFRLGGRGIFRIFQMPVLFNKCEVSIIMESLTLAGIDTKELVTCSSDDPLSHQADKLPGFWQNTNYIQNNNFVMIAPTDERFPRRLREGAYQKDCEDSSSSDASWSHTKAKGAFLRRSRKKKRCSGMDELTTDDDASVHEHDGTQVLTVSSCTSRSEEQKPTDNVISDWSRVREELKEELREELREELKEELIKQCDEHLRTLSHQVLNHKLDALREYITPSVLLDNQVEKLFRQELLDSFSSQLKSIDNIIVKTTVYENMIGFVTMKKKMKKYLLQELEIFKYNKSDGKSRDEEKSKKLVSADTQAVPEQKSETSVTTHIDHHYCKPEDHLSQRETELSDSRVQSDKSREQSGSLQDTLQRNSQPGTAPTTSKANFSGHSASQGSQPLRRFLLNNATSNDHHQSSHNSGYQQSPEIQPDSSGQYVREVTERQTMSERFKLFWIYRKSQYSGSVSQYIFAIVLTPHSQQYSLTAVKSLEDIPERLKENVTVETCSSVTFDMPAAEFHVVCNVQEITFYSTYEPARIFKQDVRDIESHGGCPPIITFETEERILRSVCINIGVLIDGLSIDKITITASINEQPQGSRLPMLSSRCCHPITEEQCENRIKRCLDTVARSMSLQSQKNSWRTYGEMLGLTRETLNGINHKYPSDHLKRIHKIHKRWITSPSFKERCVKCIANELVKALMEINEVSPFGAVSKLFGNMS